MSPNVTTLLGAVLIVGVCVLLVRALRSYLRYRNEMVVTCPETQRDVGVVVDVKRAAITGSVRLTDCTRWPEKQGCGQECLAQIEASPSACLVRSMLDQWYAGSTCAVCGKNIGPIDWFKHKPALMRPDRRTVAWNEIPAETLPEVMATHFPVCWDCHVVESVVRDHADRIVVRPPHRSAGIPGPMPGVTEGGESGGAAPAS